MRRTLALLVAVVGIGGACRSHDRAAAPPALGLDAAAVDATPLDAAPLDAGPLAVAPTLAADELARRAGQPTGLGDAGPAAVATEALIIALATGHASLSAALDARGGVVEVDLDGRGRPRARHQCGGPARDLAATYLGRAVDRQLGGAAPLRCDNQFVAAPPLAGDPRAALGRHATCRSPGDDDGGPADGLVFAVGADGALRLRAVIALTPGLGISDAATVAARALARGHCP